MTLGAAFSANKGAASMLQALLEKPAIAPRLAALETLRLPAYRYILISPAYLRSPALRNVGRED